MGEGGGLGGLIGCQDEPPHGSEAVGGQEHVLRAAQPDALSAEFSTVARVPGGVGVDPHLDVAGVHLVGPPQELVEFGRRVAVDGGQRPGVDRTGAAVDGDQVAGAQGAVADGDGAVGDVGFGGPDHRGDAPAPGHHGRVADQSAPGGEDAVGGLHAHDIVGGGLGPYEDDGAPLVGGPHGVLGAEHDLAAPRTR